MGVTKLWELLDNSAIGEEVPLSQCYGQSWAVDLSAWILHGRSVAGAAGLSADYTMINTVFHRALCLMGHGIKPVFVMDGRMAPDIKSHTMQDRSERAFSKTKMTANDRSGLQYMNNVCREILESLGLQVITSSGEAEKTCALLNHKGIVDACLSDDSDCFPYGASTVYRNLEVKKETVQKYTSSEIEQKLNLNREDLVVMALLGGCDYGGGVKMVGKTKALELITAMKQYSSDVLQRVCGWRDNMDLCSIEREIHSLTKSPHCKQCQHTGNKLQHRRTGCSTCGSTTGCVADSDQRCDCEYHAVKWRTDPYVAELNIRKKAMEDSTFPDKTLVTEFLHDEQKMDVREVRISLPRWGELADKVGIALPDLMKKLIPVLVHMHLYGTLELPGEEPDSILDNCKRKFVPCYLVTWKRFAFDKWSITPVMDIEKTPTRDLESKNPYVVAVPCQLFEAKYPQMVSGYKPSTSGQKGKGKRPKEDKSQPTLMDFFKVTKAKKVLNFEDYEKQ